MGPALFISSSNPCDLTPGPFDSSSEGWQGYRTDAYLHLRVLKKEREKQSLKSDHRIGKNFPRAILNLALWSRSVNGKQLIQKQWGLFLLSFFFFLFLSFCCRDPSAVQMAGWHSPVCFCLSFYILGYFLVPLYFAFIFSLYYKPPNFRGKGRLQGLGRVWITCTLSP